MFVFNLVCITVCPFYFCNHIDVKIVLVALLLLSFGCLVTVTVL